jgi:flagellar motor switch protein FliM
MDPQFPAKKLGKVKYVESYDFKHPKLFSKEIMRTLRLIHDTLGRNLSRIFSTSLRYKVDTYLKDIEQLSPTELIQGIESPSVIYLLEIENMDGEMIVVMPPELCIHMIERQSGGPGNDLAEPRSLTVIEEKIISRIIRHINSEIVEAWEPFKDFTIEKTKYENKPDNIHLASVDPTIMARFVIDLGENKVEIKVVYTYSLLKEILNDTILKKDLRSKMERLNEDEMAAYKRTIEKATISLHALLGTTRLSLDEVLNLKEGDAIPLSQKADQPLEVRVNGVKKMTAFPGVIQGRKAIKIFELVEEINEQELV